MTRARPRGGPITARTPLAALGSRDLSRRGLLAGSLAGGLAASLAACGAPSAVQGNDRTVRYWNLFQGADGARMVSMQDAVSEQTGITIDSTVLAWGAPYYTKLAMSSAGGRSPEIAITHLSRLAGYAPGGLLDPWDLDLLAEFGVEESQFPAAIIERARYRDELYAVPLDTHPFVVMYDTDIAGQAGLLDGDGKLAPITSPQAFLDAGRALQEVTGEVGISFGFANDTGQTWRLFYTLYPQLAGELDLSGKTVEIDRPAAVQVVDFMKQMVDGTIAARGVDYPAGLATFTSGRAGMILTGEWELPGYIEAGVPLGAAPFPTLFGTPSAFADSHAFVLPHQDTPDEDRRRSAHEAVATILKESLTWAEAGHVPSYGPVAESPEYAALTPQSDYVAAAEVAKVDPAAWFTGAGSDFQAQVSSVLNAACAGGPSAEEAVDEVVRRIEVIMAKPNPVGEPV